jgi:hypothetical protein
MILPEYSSFLDPVWQVEERVLLSQELQQVSNRGRIYRGKSLDRPNHHTFIFFCLFR